MSINHDQQHNLFPHMSVPVINKEGSSELMEIETISNSPLKLIGAPGKGYWIALGKYRITEIKPTKDEAVELLLTEEWNIIINLVVLICDEIIENHEKNKKIHS